jgi:hypothetical protein
VTHPDRGMAAAGWGARGAGRARRVFEDPEVSVAAERERRPAARRVFLNGKKLAHCDVLRYWQVSRGRGIAGWTGEDWTYWRNVEAAARGSEL